MHKVYGHLFEGRDSEAADALEVARARALATPLQTRTGSAVVSIEP
jgi:hypothetical protein